jgi:hypothetical protein
MDEIEAPKSYEKIGIKEEDWKKGRDHVPFETDVDPGH